MLKEVKKYIIENEFTASQANLYVVTKIKTENLADKLSASDLIDLFDFLNEISIEEAHEELLSDRNELIKNEVRIVDKNKKLYDKYCEIREKLEKLQPKKYEKDTWEIIGMRKNKHECGIRVNVNGRKQLFCEDSGLQFEVTIQERPTITVLDWNCYGEISDYHVSKVIISGDYETICKFQNKIGY